MSVLPRRRFLLALLGALSLVLVGLAVSAAVRDTDPPQLYFEAQERLPAGEPLRLFVSADEPATFRLEYAGQVVEEVAQDVTFDVPVAPGVHPARVTATDGAGNASELTTVVTGVPALAPTLEAATLLRSGDPLGIRLSLHEAGTDAALRAQVADVLVTLGERVVPTRRVTDGADERLEALVATPLTVDPTTLGLRVVVTDEFGRVAELEREVVLEPLPVEVEQLRLSAATLAIVTPEARDLEAAVLAEAWARAEPEPLWSEPFRMPIGGVNTSGFGDARRYAQGGPVSFHNGLDLAAPMGTPVYATNAGRVLVSGHYPIKGGFVVLDHGGGVMSYYLHLSRLLVAEGQAVAGGELIGEVGSEGLSTGPHLHWEMRVHDQPSNPLAWVDRAFPGEAP
ncbi:MAG: M23 family metallopeptidase [Deinococcales bacterium]|nr:M23 family metallopeptidase [Deinococcales bacterium]